MKHSLQISSSQMARNMILEETMVNSISITMKIKRRLSRRTLITNSLFYLNEVG